MMGLGSLIVKNGPNNVIGGLTEGTKTGMVNVR